MIEGVVAESADVRLKDDIGRRLPQLAHALLRNREALADHVEEMPRTFQMDPVCAQVDGNNSLGTYLFQGNGGHSMGQHSIDVQMAIDFYRQEHPWIGATRSHRVY